jgi:hypothetical protein
MRFWGSNAFSLLSLILSPTLYNKQYRFGTHIGLDVGCGCGHSTKRLRTMFPHHLWIGIDKRNDIGSLHVRTDFFNESDHNQWILPLCSSADSVALAFCDSLQEMYSDEQWSARVHRLLEVCPRLSLIINDQYPDILFQQIQFRLWQEFGSSMRLMHVENDPYIIRPKHQIIIWQSTLRF